jgi:hypothetical protein
MSSAIHGEMRPKPARRIDRNSLPDNAENGNCKT